MSDKEIELLKRYVSGLNRNNLSLEDKRYYLNLLKENKAYVKKECFFYIYANMLNQISIGGILATIISLIYLKNIMAFNSLIFFSLVIPIQTIFAMIFKKIEEQIRKEIAWSKLITKLQREITNETKKRPRYFIGLNSSYGHLIGEYRKANHQEQEENNLKNTFIIEKETVTSEKPLIRKRNLTKKSGKN